MTAHNFIPANKREPLRTAIAVAALAAECKMKRNECMRKLNSAEHNRARIGAALIKEYAAKIEKEYVDHIGPLAGLNFEIGRGDKKRTFEADHYAIERWSTIVMNENDTSLEEELENEIDALLIAAEGE